VLYKFHNDDYNCRGDTLLTVLSCKFGALRPEGHRFESHFGVTYTVY